MIRIILNLDEALLQKIDSLRSKHGTPRSEFIRRTLNESLGYTPISKDIPNIINKLQEVSPKELDLCPHGAMKGLCKKGCK